MMDCDCFEETLNADLDNLLSVAERQEMLKHMDSCLDCRKKAAEYEQLMDLFPAMDDVEVPAGFTAGVMSRISAMPTHLKVVQPETKRSFKSLYYGLALAASIVGLVFFLDSSKLQEPQLAKVLVEDSVTKLVQGTTPIYEADFSLLSSRGRVQVFPRDGFSWQDFSEDLKLRFGDKIRTLSDSQVHLKYQDQTELKLSSNTLIEVESRGVRVFQGDSWIKVVKKGRSFEARTPNLVASVRGTMYDVSVRYSQQAYADFLAGITQKNILKSMSPEIYLREFSLETLNEVGSSEFSQFVESKVRVFESRVFVSPVNSPQGILVEQGSSVKIRSKGLQVSLDETKALEAKDFKYWDVAVPQWLKEKQVSNLPQPQVLKTEAEVFPTAESSEAEAQVEPEALGSDEISPVDSFDELYQD
jgi:hypothetical protein